MEELETLVKLVAGLPTLTIWILAGYLIYRLVVIGSIYGVIKLAISRYYDYKTAPQTYKVADKALTNEVRLSIEGQLARIGSTGYIHHSDVDKLRKAIDLIEQGDVK